MASGRAIKAGQAYVELFADNTKLVRGLNAAQGRIAAFGSAIQGIGMRMTAMAAAVAAPAAISLKTFAEFEDEMARVRAVTGATDAEFQSLYETAKRLGATTTFSAVQVAQGVRALGSAGLEAHEILAAIPSTLHLARVGVMEIGEAANIVEDVGSAFGLAADQVGRIVDTLATTQARGNAAAREMSQGLRSVAPIATTAGQSLEMVAAAIDVLADRGVDAASAGTDLARILTNLATPDVQQALEGMGVATVDAAGGMRSLGAVMADLGRATAAMPDSRQLDLFDAMFGRSRRSAIVLAQHAGALAHLHGALLAASGAGATMAAIMENTLGGSMRALLSALQAVQIAFGEALVDDIRKAVGGLTGFARQVANLVAANRDVVVSFARWAAAFGLIGVGLVTVGLALHTAAAGIGGVLIPAQLLAGLLATMAGLFAALLSPVGLVAVAVAGVGGALTDLSRLGGTVLTWLTQRFKDLSTAAVQAFEGIADALAAGDITLAVRVLWAGIKAEFAGGTNWLLVQWADVRAGVLKILEGTIQGTLAAWESMVHGFAVAWIEGVAILKRVWAHFAGWHQKAVEHTANFMARRWIEFMGLFDSTIDTDAAKAHLDRMAKDNLAAIDRDRDDQISQVDASRTVGRDRARRQYEQNMVAIGSQYEATAAALEADKDARLAALQADLQAAKAELAASVAKAKQARERAEAGNVADKAGEALTAIKTRIDEAVDGLFDSATGTMSVVGTFDATATYGLGGQDAMAEVAANTKKTAENTSSINRNLKRSTYGG